MKRKNFSFFAIALLSVVISCSKKDGDEDYCRELRDGVTNSNVEQVNYAITQFIKGLPSQDYTEENINNLVNVIGDYCDGSPAVLCFDCIKTLPSQTEIQIGYPGTSGLVTRTIDITYTTNNQMKFSNLHD
jgi:hypothetical protein